MPALDAEVAGQAAAPTDRFDRRTGPPQQRLVGRPTHNGVVVAVRLSHRPDTGEVGQVHVPLGEELRERTSGPGDRGRPLPVGVVGEQVEGVAAEHGRAGRLQADDRDAGRGRRRERGHAAAENLSGTVELTGADPGEAAAQPAGRDAYGEARALEHGDRGDAHVRREVVGERVDPEEHRIAGRARVVGEPLPERTGGKARRVAARIDAGEAFPDAGAGATECGVDQTWCLRREPRPPG